MLVGAVNGFAVVGLGILPLLATLASMNIVAGIELSGRTVGGLGIRTGASALPPARPARDMLQDNPLAAPFGP